MSVSTVSRDDSPASLTLGPVLFNWDAERWRDFYFRIADEAPVDLVYVGETVCFKRAPFIMPHLDAVLERLKAGGKQVIGSTLGLVMDRKDRDLVHRIVERDDILVEANDVSAIAQLQDRPHFVGPLINVYNEDTLALAARNGAVHACLTAEIPGTIISILAQNSPVPLEVQVFGRMPLALSARCYHARAHDLHKDSCQYVCALDPDGMDVDTLDGAPFLAVNGTQTMSYSYLNLSAEIPALRQQKINAFRLWPHTVDMVVVAGLYRDLLDEKIDGHDVVERLEALLPDVSFSNGYYHGQEGHRYVSRGDVRSAIHSEEGDRP